MVMPADGPSFGIRTGGDVHVEPPVRRGVASMPSAVGVRPQVGQRDLAPTPRMTSPS